MLDIFIAYAKICIFRIGPQNLPYSRFLLVFTLTCYLLLGVTMSLATSSIGKSVAFTLTDLSLLSGLTAIVLWIRDLSPRFIQTLTAIAGSAILFGIINWCLIMWDQQLNTSAQSITAPKLLAELIRTWNLAVIGHILRHALSVSFIAGILLAILYLYISVNVLMALFGPAI